MLIDFHAHIFPDAIAPRAIASLKTGMKALHGFVLPTYSDGTAAGLIKSMDAEGVSASVILPIATKPSQAAGINGFAASVASDRIIPFGSVHPMQDNWEETLEAIAGMGFKGIKLHPEFQSAYIDSPECLRIIKKAGEMGLMVVIHAGEDIGYPPPVHATPQRIRRALDFAPDTTVIAAHMGGMNEWDDVQKFLIDTPIYLDTAFVQTSMPTNVFRDIVKMRGAERVLFASDSPWSRPSGDSLSYIMKAGLTQSDVELITHLNAERLLCMRKR